MWENRDSAQVDGLSGYHDLGYHHSDECSIVCFLMSYLRIWVARGMVRHLVQRLDLALASA